MSKIKIFTSHNPEILELQVNDWIKSQENIVVSDIKFQVDKKDLSPFHILVHYFGYDSVSY